MSTDFMTELRSRLSGEVVGPDDPAYDEARRVWNGMIDRRPLAIAGCRTAGDVALSIKVAREHGLRVAVRGGAHNVAGNATCDGGLVIDLSAMKSIAIDEARGTARAEAGLLWGEFDSATAEHGLATTGGLVSTTGIAGFTLGGGLGWLMRKHGLACDNLLGADVITANGESLRVSSSEHPELLWGLRGGGGNFGVATSFEYQLHPVSMVTGGMALHTLEQAPAALRFLREFAGAAPDELTSFGAFITAPPMPMIPAELQGRIVLALVVCHAGDLDAGERLIAPLRQFGPPAFEHFGAMPYTVLQTMFDAGAPRGMHNYWKSAYLPELSDAAIDAMLPFVSGMRSPLTAVHLHHMEGAVSRVPAGATAFSHRRAAYAFNVVGMWADAAESDLHTQWVRDLYAAVQPHTSGTYVNFLGDEGQDRVRAAYGPETYARLEQLKAQYDPDNFFRLNQNIPPAGRPS
jgi:FAD/FMN-containing dehydrogenase